MSNKTKFEEMYSKNVSDKTEKKNGLTYLSWAYAWAELKKLDEKADFQIHENSEGLPYFASPLGIDCKVSVTANGVTHTMRLPVMDGANKTQKTEAYTITDKWGKEKTVAAANMFDVNKTIMRCLVKAIAMHGLGLYIYAGEDLPEETGVDVKQENKRTLPGTNPPIDAPSDMQLASDIRPTPEEKITAANPENSVNVVTTKKAGWGSKKINKATETKTGELY